MTVSVELPGRDRSVWAVDRGGRVRVWRRWIVRTMVVGGGLSVGLAASSEGVDRTASIALCAVATAGVAAAAAFVDAVPATDPHGRSERLIRAASGAVVLVLAVAGAVPLVADEAPDRWQLAAAAGVAWAALAVVALQERRIADAAVAETPSAAAELDLEVSEAGGTVVACLTVDDEAALSRVLLDRTDAAVLIRPELLDRGVPELLLRHGGGRLLCLVPGAHAAKVRLAPLGELPLVELSADPLPPVCRAAKRSIDLALATAVLLVTSPLLLLTAVAIRLDSRGPWLFHQERVGADGRLFRMHKLRTMRVDEAADRHREYVAGMIEGRATQVAGLYKLVDDDRRTRAGRVLRKLSIDEVPQLWNVLRGEMSIVGPRPALPQEVERYRPPALLRLAIQPGLTGLWQVSGRSRIGFDEMVELDTEYWRRWSVSLDLRILARTPWALLRGETA